MLRQIIACGLIAMACGIEFLRRPEEGACDVLGGRPVVHEDFLRSPEFPENYPNNAVCEWYAVASGGEDDTIKLTFIDFSIEQSFLCENDGVVVYNHIPTNVSVPMSRSCGDVVPNAVQSNELFIRFYSDQSVSGPGFQAIVTDNHNREGGWP